MNERILVVDDEQPIREVVCSMLGAADYRCEEADSGLSALAVLSSDPQFDMVLTGLMMPEVSGLQLLERLNSAHPHLPLPAS
jgi:CheY-like chemotaxis protein